MPHHIYKSHFIKSVVFRIDFPIPIPSLEALEKPIEFQRAVLGTFPIMEETKVVKGEVQFTPQGVNTKQKDKFLFNFKNPEKTCTLGLTSEFLFIEHTKYDGYENFIRLVELATNSLFRLWPTTPINRLGLRYQNEINIPNPQNRLDWSQFISPRLLSAQGLFGGTDKLTRYIVHSEVKTDDYFGRIVTGIPNPDYPGTIQQRQFVIDIDIYLSEAIDQQEIKPKLDLFHDAIIGYFETAIEQPLRDHMDAA
jgi:uncharacterized protein (TIGR04255 family)